jgi:hypothetical protein
MPKAFQFAFDLLSLFMTYLIPNVITAIVAIIAAEAIKDLPNAVLGSSPFSPKYSINGKLIMGHNIMAILRMFHPVVKLSLFTLKLPQAPVISFIILFRSRS